MGNQVVAAFSGVPPKFSKRYISETKRSYDLKFSGFPFFNSIYLTVNCQGDLKGFRGDHSVSWHGKCNLAHFQEKFPVVHATLNVKIEV